MLYAQQEKIINWQQEWEEPRSLSPLRLWHSKLHNHEWLSSSCENRIIVTLVKNNFCSSKESGKNGTFSTYVSRALKKEKNGDVTKDEMRFWKENCYVLLYPLLSLNDFFKSTIKCIQDDCKGVKLFLKVFRRVENLRELERSELSPSCSRMTHFYRLQFISKELWVSLPKAKEFRLFFSL